MNRKEREIEQRRKTILRKARKLFLKKGYDAVTIKEIAETSEFSRVTVYSYFQSKMDIFLPVIFTDLRSHYEDLSRLVESHDSASEKLIAAGWGVYDFYKKTPGLHLLISQYHKHDLSQEKVSERSLRKVEEAKELSHVLFRSILGHGIRTGEFRDDLNLEVAVSFYRKSVYAIVHQYVFTPDLDPDLLNLELTYLLRAFEKPGSSE